MEEVNKKAPSKTLEEIAKEQIAKEDNFVCRVFCCNSTSCRSAQGISVLDAFNDCLKVYNLEDKVDICPAGCMGLCAEGPLVRVEVKGQEPVLYKTVKPLIARLIVAEHIIPASKVGEGEVFEVPPFLMEHTLSLKMPFFAEQTKVVLSNVGKINPESIDDYIAHGGYAGLKKVLTKMKPSEVVDEIKKSGLRGRGGGGFPTGLKWEFASKSKGEEKFVICNGDEGDPGAYMDSGILEGDPHAVLEGMIIAGYAQLATQGWLYIRAEYPLAVERINNAIKQARRLNLLGKNILGTGFDFDCEVRLGAGAFVCGEETALIASIEGKRGTPRPRPPYPTDKGLWNMPSCINNVETFANVAKIISFGSEWYSSIGTQASKGTKVFALTGRVKHGGLVEVPMGMSINNIVKNIGGGCTGDKKIKAVQTGGPSGGVIPERLHDMPVCYDKLKEVGSIMGSGGMIVMDEDDSLVEIAKFYLGFAVEESCGKCAPCRIGGTQMLKILTRISERKGTKKDIETLKRLAIAMKKGSLCGLGQTTPNPILSTLQYFEDEYLERIVDNEE
ncbi:MAG: NADH-ubiquinone oxidoreductase-F iron-sulfur binding region domain-containing protein [Alphaproteobacteria bacterium]